MLSNFLFILNLNKKDLFILNDIMYFSLECSFNCYSIFMKVQFLIVH